MPRYRVEIKGDGLVQVMLALNNANIPTIGPASVGFGDSPDNWIVGRDMTAFVDAEGPQEAADRVQANLPNGDFTVRPLGPWGEDGE